MSDKVNSKRLTALDESRSLSSINNTAILNFMNSQSSSTVSFSSSKTNTNTNNSSNKNSKYILYFLLALENTTYLICIL